MIFLTFCLLVAAAMLAAHLLMPKHPWIYCAFYGHEPKMDPVPVCGTLTWHCENCKRRMSL